MIDTIGSFNFDPNKIESIRKDTFAKGSFSIFVILVHLNSNESIDLVYHFYDKMNTYVIDSVNDI